MGEKARRIVKKRAGNHWILGRRLNILCADNLELLDARGCSFIYGSVPDPKELIDAIAILSQEPENAASDMESDRLWRCFGGWVDKHIFRSMVSTSLLQDILKGEADYELALQALDLWLADNWKPPELRWNKGSSKEATSPYTDHIRLKLCELGLCKDVVEAGSYPISDALWDAEASFEKETGESRMESEADRKADLVIEESIRMAEEESKANKAKNKTAKKKKAKKNGE